MGTPQQQIKTKKPTGRYWAIAFAFISFVAGLSERKDGFINKSNDNFLTAIITIAGIILFTLGKKRKMGVNFTGSIIVEGIIFIAILYIFIAGLLNTGWENNPLTWTVTPLWALIAYLSAVFASPKNNSDRKL